MTNYTFIDLQKIFNTVVYISSDREAEMAIDFFSRLLDKPKDRFFYKPQIGYYYGFICTNEGVWDHWDVTKGYTYVNIHQLEPDIEDGFSVYKIE